MRFEMRSIPAFFLFVRKRKREKNYLKKKRTKNQTIWILCWRNIMKFLCWLNDLHVWVFPLYRCVCVCVRGSWVKVTENVPVRLDCSWKRLLTSIIKFNQLAGSHSQLIQCCVRLNISVYFVMSLWLRWFW